MVVAGGEFEMIWVVQGVEELPQLVLVEGHRVIVPGRGGVEVRVFGP
jgi:hypothetical protein